MVNTFLVYSDFRKSAASLDRARLGKQRVEAYQILQICYKIHVFCLCHSLKIPQTYEEFKNVLSIIHRSCYDVKIIPLMDKIAVYITKLENPKRKGFIGHPAVWLWFGYEEALKAYINAHIEEWIKRGYQNTMITYYIKKNYERPPWTNSDKIYQNHRGALLEKEKSRNEKPHYLYQTDFVKSPHFDDYLWDKFLSKNNFSES